MIEENVMIPTREGPRIGARIYRPDDGASHPALYAASPYRCDNDEAPPTPMFMWRETGPVRWYVETHGYAFVHADVLGTGRSEGEYRFLDRHEQQAHYDVIEWIAAQPWSSDKIGGIGQSYYCMSQWLMALQHPPHLTCIAAYDGLIDPYQYFAYTGGIETGYTSFWYNVACRVANGYPANGAPARHLTFDLPGAAMVHPLYDEFWRERSALERVEEIQIPLYSIGVWAKHELHLSGNIGGYLRAQGPKKLLISGTASGVTSMTDFNSIAFHEEHLLPFYDHYLKDRETSYASRPPVEYQVWNTGERRSASTWPPPDAQSRRLYLHPGPAGAVESLNDGALKSSPAEAGGSPTSYTYPDPHWSLGLGVGVIGADGALDTARRVLTFATDPLESDVELASSPVLVIFASTTARDTDFIVKLCEQQSSGRGTIVTRGWLRASHRVKHAARSTADYPAYDHSQQRFLEPGEIYQFEIPLEPTAYRFRKGSRIRIEIANYDSPQADRQFAHIYQPAKMGTDTIYHDSAHGSYLQVQVAAATRDARIT